MPIFMDLHKVPGIEARHAAEAHKEDLKIQDTYGCRCITYWVDESRGHAFCLIDAPSREAVKLMHDNSHGLIPHEIIQVNSNVVEAFLGRIHDPHLTTGNNHEDVSILNNPAFRVIINFSIEDILKLSVGHGHDKASKLIHLFQSKLRENIEKYEGRFIENQHGEYMASFVSVSQAMKCIYTFVNNLHIAADMLGLRISVNAGIPLDGGKELFENTIKHNNRMSQLGGDSIVILSYLVSSLYMEDSQFSLPDGICYMLTKEEDELLNKIFSVLEENYMDPHFDMEGYSNKVNMSKSSLYRASIKMCAISPNQLLKKYRIHIGLKKLRLGSTVTEACYECGFSSPSYFIKCFSEEVGVTPKEYVYQR